MAAALSAWVVGWVQEVVSAAMAAVTAVVARLGAAATVAMANAAAVSEMVRFEPQAARGGTAHCASDATLLAAVAMLRAALQWARR